MQLMDNRVEPNAEVMGAQYFRLTMTGDEVVPEPVVSGLTAYWDSLVETLPTVVLFPVQLPEVIDEVVVGIEPVIESEPTPVIIEAGTVVEAAELPIIPAPSIPPIEIIDSTPVEEVQPQIQVEPEFTAEPVLTSTPAPWYSRLWILLNTDILILAKRAYSWWVNL